VHLLINHPHGFHKIQQLYWTMYTLIM